MESVEWFGIRPMWIVGAMIFILLTLGLTIRNFRNRRNLEAGPQKGEAADPEQVVGTIRRIRVDERRLIMLFAP
jgi:hypothetical protein